MAINVYPMEMLSELDCERYEIRKVEIYRDGSLDWADASRETDTIGLGQVLVPSLADINADPEFSAKLIDAAEFEEFWVLAKDAVFRKFDEVVRATNAGPADDLGFLDEFERVEVLIERGLSAAATSADWYVFQEYLFLAGRRPSSRYVPVFCAMLDRKVLDAALGDVLEYLRDIKDPVSVPAVERVLRWRPEWDEFHDLAFKALDVLLAIDDDEAWRVLESFRDDDRERVREIVRRGLARR